MTQKNQPIRFSPKAIVQNNIKKNNESQKKFDEDFAKNHTFFDKIFSDACKKYGLSESIALDYMEQNKSSFRD